MMNPKKKDVKDMTRKERAAYRKIVFQRIVKRNGDALKRLSKE